MAKQLKIVGITISITFIMFIALAIFIKSLGIVFDSWFAENALWIAIISGIIVLIGIITGTIAVKALTSSSKGIFS
jgi:hypothetical protein